MGTRSKVVKRKLFDEIAEGFEALAAQRHGKRTLRTHSVELNPAPDGTAVVITERGEVSNPLFRFMSRYVMGQTGTILADLRAMGTHFGADVTPQELPPPQS